ncbi:MAG TPA: peptide ABC transporter permease, partial [Microlunatus sp.]|nr:peptide ABC transporter permease [Microlunatus sp.]
MTDNRAEVAFEVDGDELTPIEPGPGEKRITRRRLIGRRFLRNRTAVVGAVVILLLIILALIGPYISPYAYDEIDRRAYLKPPSETHLLGTTQSGRDMLALTLRGLRKSLLIGFLVAIISTS